MSKNIVLFRAVKGIALAAVALLAATVAIHQAKAAENLPPVA